MYMLFYMITVFGELGLYKCIIWIIFIVSHQDSNTINNQIRNLNNKQLLTWMKGSWQICSSGGAKLQTYFKILTIVKYKTMKNQDKFI